MKCEEMLKLLGDYIDGEIDPELCAQFEQHMRQCPRCQVVVDTLRKTVAIYREGELLFEMPLPVRERLHQKVREAWREKFGSPE